MRIYNRKDFLALPDGTIYRKGKPQYFGNLSIKSQTIGNDFVCMEVGQWFAEDSGDWSDKFDEMMNGKSYPMTDDFFGRDGCFDNEDIFLVFDKFDLEVLQRFINAAPERGE